MYIVRVQRAKITKKIYKCLKWFDKYLYKSGRVDKLLYLHIGGVFLLIFWI